jgi:hypothetical protein
MFPQIRHIHKLVVEPQSAQDESAGADGSAKGMGAARAVLAEDGCDVRRVWE